jgi:hypothetical protein
VAEISLGPRHERTFHSKRSNENKHEANNKTTPSVTPANSKPPTTQPALPSSRPSLSFLAQLPQAYVRAGLRQLLAVVFAAREAKRESYLWTASFFLFHPTLKLRSSAAQPRGQTLMASWSVTLFPFLDASRHCTPLLSFSMHTCPAYLSYK